MSLYEMPAHPCCRRDCTFKVDIAILLEGSEIRPAKRFGCYANFEGRFLEGDDRQAGAVYADAVAEMAVVQDFGGVRDGERCASIFGLGIEFGDH